MLVVADRLKLPIQKVLDMPMSHFNLWIAYLKKEQDEYKNQRQAQQQLSKYR
jgi:hypothetical protein|tara:strand:- start:351 stop:506 length:156 start_codon:yes stop_codon:yes gene_type:complete